MAVLYLSFRKQEEQRFPLPDLSAAPQIKRGVQRRMLIETTEKKEEGEEEAKLVLLPLLLWGWEVRRAEPNPWL